MHPWYHTGCLLGLSAGAVCAAEVAVSTAPRTAALLRQATAEVRIVCFGDSITGVYYHTGGLRAWPELLRDLLRQRFPNTAVRVTNAGISGNTTAAALARMQGDVLDVRPHLVAVMFGMNDLAYGPADAARDAERKQAYCANLEQIVARSREAGAEVILMTPNPVYPESAPGRPPERIAEFAGVVREVGAALGVPVVDAFAEYEHIRRADVARWRRMMSETIHPSVPGHLTFAEGVAAAIAGEPVTLAGLAPTRPCLSRTAAALRAGETVTVVVADICQEAVLGVLREAAPAAPITPVSWPVGGQSLGQIEAWAKGIRQQAGRVLVVGSFSPQALVPGPSEEAFVRQAAWVACHALAFGRREWDVLFVAPSGPLSPEQQAGAALARGMVEAHDLVWVEAADPDALREWFRRELAASGSAPP